jgi:hypothetical protein
MTLEQFAEDTITNWYAMGEKDFPTCLELAESLGLWNFAAELKMMEKVNQQNRDEQNQALRELLYYTTNPLNNGY